MHILSIHDTEYKAIEDWPEMSTAKAIEVNQVVHDMPELLRKLYDHSTKKNPDQKETDELYAEVTTEDRIKIFPVFYGEIMRVLTTIPGQVMEGILWDVRTQFYKQYCEHLVQGILFGDYSSIKGIENFEWNEHTYWLPTSGHFLNTDQSVPMEHESTIVFTEVADLEIYSEQLKGGKYEVAPNIISILCRHKNEHYDEKRSLERAKEFLDLPMNIVWEVFFCIQQLSIISSQNILILKLRKEVRTQRKLKRQALSRLGGTEESSKSQSRGYLNVV